MGTLYIDILIEESLRKTGALPSGRRQTLGKEFFKFFLIFCLFSLPSALSLALGKDPLCRVLDLALGKDFFFAPRFFR